MSEQPQPDQPQPDPAQPETLHDGDERLSGDTVDESVAVAEEGSQVEGVHTPSGHEPSGDSRVERMADVDGITDPD